MNATEQMADRLRPLRERFVERARHDGIEIQRAWQAEDWAALARLSHGLAGNAGMFGFPEISDLARSLEDAVRDGGKAEAADAAQALLGRLSDLEATS